jgi:hypothetical protein
LANFEQWVLSFEHWLIGAGLVVSAVLLTLAIRYFYLRGKPRRHFFVEPVEADPKENPWKR